MDMVCFSSGVNGQPRAAAPESHHTKVYVVGVATHNHRRSSMSPCAALNRAAVQALEEALTQALGATEDEPPG